VCIKSFFKFRKYDNATALLHMHDLGLPSFSVLFNDDVC